MTKPVVSAFVAHLADGCPPSISPGLRGLVPSLTQALTANDGTVPPFEAVLGEIAAHTGSFVERALSLLYPERDKARPNVYHEIFARLLGEAGGPDFLVTTNFDECLERAGITSDLVTWPDRDEFKPPIRGLLKLHGTISHPGSLAATPAGLKRRRNSPDWVKSLVAAIGGRDVVFIGYSRSDWFDIEPALRVAHDQLGTRYFVVQRTVRSAIKATGEAELEPEGKRFVDLERDENPLLGPEVSAGSPPGGHDAVGVVRQALGRVERPHPLAALRALAGLLHRLERGEDALRLFALADELDPDREAPAQVMLMATALVRARRYRAAGRRLANLIELGPGDDFRLAVQLHCTAGFVAQAGGRFRESLRQYAKAVEWVARAGGSTADWQAELLDQFWRGRAENLLGLAQRTTSRSVRSRALRAAQSYCDRLQDYERDLGLPLNVSILVAMLPARIALAMGDRTRAERILIDVQPLIRHWADPHARIVHARLLAAASPARRTALLRRARGISVEAGLRQEWLKVWANSLGFFGLGHFGPVQMLGRDITISAYDWAKDASTVLFHRWAR